MTRRHYRHRRSRRPGMFHNVLPSFLLIVFGASGFYAALQWFRSDASTTEAMTPEVAVLAPVGQVTEQIATTVPAQALTASVPLISRFDGQHTGKIDRYPVAQGFEYYVLAYLPALDPALETYHVWLLKDGLADVRDMGELTVRADGSWVGHVVADSLHGVSDAETYSSIVIMRQLVDEGASTLGSKIAEAKF